MLRSRPISLRWAVIGLAGAALSPGASLAGEAPTIAARQEALPLSAYYAPSPISSPAVSPDGKLLSYLVLTELNPSAEATAEDSQRYALRIVPSEEIGSKPTFTLGSDKMSIMSVQWLANEVLLVWALEEPPAKFQAPFVFKTYLLNIKTGNLQEVPSKRGISRTDADEMTQALNSAQVIGFDPQDSNKVLLAWSDADSTAGAPVFELDIRTGEAQRVMRPRTSMGQYRTDLDGEIRLATGYSNGVTIAYGRLKGKAEWTELRRTRLRDKDGFDILGFVPGEPNTLYVASYGQGDKLGVYKFDMASKAITEHVFTPPRGDVAFALEQRHSGRSIPVGVAFTDRGLRNAFFDADEQALYTTISQALATAEGKGQTGYFQIDSRSNDDSAIVISTTGVNRPGAFYLLRDRKTMQLISLKVPTIAKAPRHEYSAITYNARDGLKIEGMLAKANQPGPRPTIIMPHGGPWARDYLHYDDWSEMLASRGYNVFRPNYRGSTGYGRAYWLAGNAQWGMKMQDDLDDAAAFLVKEGIADPKHLIMFGYSYGGYAAMMAPLRDNPPYRCAIAGAGVSNLDKIRKQLWTNRVARQLQYDEVGGISPEYEAEKAKIPILLIHPELDKIVPISHAADYAAALKKHGKPHKLVVMPHASHPSMSWSYASKKIFYEALFDFLENECGGANGLP